MLDGSRGAQCLDSGLQGVGIRCQASHDQVAGVHVNLNGGGLVLEYR